MASERLAGGAGCQSGASGALAGGRLTGEGRPKSVTSPPDSCCLPPPNELQKHCPPQQSTSCRLDFVLRALCLTGSSFFPVLRINWVWLADWTLPCQYVHACVATSLCKHGGIQPKLPTRKLMELIWRFPHSAQCRLYLAFHGSYSVFLSALF